MAPRIHIDLTPFTRFAIYGLGLALCGTAAAGASIAYDRVHEAREQANEMAQRAAVANARIASLEWESQHLSRSLHALEQQDNRLRAVLAQTIATATTTSGNAPAVSVAALPATTMSATDRETVDSNTIPSIDPTNGGEVTSTFGWRTTPWPEFHKGIDLAQPQGHPVMASAAGIVVTADPGWNGGFGNFIDIDHGNGFHTYYGHLSSIYVHAGAHVIRGMVIAAVGMTGEATGPHLHYQIMHNGVAIDPAPFLHGVPAWAVASSGTTKTKI
jgi:murein DD-endopeptidase MepM/ murein hydrolase activator NlpD